MLLIVDGRVSVTVRLPGDRAVEIASLGRGRGARRDPAARRRAPLGHRARDRAREPALARAARTSPRWSRGTTRRRSPSSGASPASPARGCAGSSRRSRRRSAGDARRAAVAGDGDRRRPRALRAAGQHVRATARELPRVRLARAVGLPDRRPLRPLPGRGARSSPRGAVSTACYLTMNGAVEKVIVRGGRRIRIGLAGPGQAFGYEGLIDGGPSPMTATTRERTLLLVLPQEAFERLFDGEDARLARVPRRDPARPDGDAAPGPPPARPAGVRASSRRAAAAGPPGPR